MKSLTSNFFETILLAILYFLFLWGVSGTSRDFSLLELFSTCDLGEGSFPISLLAVKSWLSLISIQRVTLFQTDHESCVRVRAFFEEARFRCIVLNESTDDHMLRVDHLFEAALNHTATAYVGYLNCDIAVFSEFDLAVQNILHSDKSSKRVIVGQRRDFSFPSSSLDVFMKNISLVRENALRYGSLHESFGKDYFVFPRDLLKDFPSFLIGRPKWDDWFLTKLLVQDPYCLSIYRLDESIPVVHMEMGKVTRSHEKLGVRRNEALFTYLWTCQPISDILNVETVVAPANCSEEYAFQMTESFPNAPLQLLFARKSHCNETLYLYEDLSFGAEFDLSFRKITESCKQCIHIVHTLTACIYCRRYAIACICMDYSENSLQRHLQRELPLISRQTQQLELLRRRFYILATAVENGYKVNYQIGGKIPRSDLVILKEHPKDLAYTKDFLRTMCGSYEFAPQRHEFIVLKPSETAREFLTLLHICISKFTTSNFEEPNKQSSKGLQWTHSFKKCVESLGIPQGD